MHYPPTPRQREFELILKHLTEEADGVPPTLREIAEVMGVSESAVAAIADRLIARGRLRKLRHTKNSLQLIPEGTAA
jgi:DNA-binding MarR family transcriptional regulator